MRAGPLSSNAVIQTLNSSFVPVHVSEQLGGRGGSASTEERLLQAVILERFRRKGLPTGTVSVYILSPDGDAIEYLHVAKAVEEGRLIDLLERNAKRFEVAASKPLVGLRAGATPPAAPAGGVVLHLASRGWNRGSWREFPAENWIPLSPAEVGHIIGGGPPDPGAHWIVSKGVSQKILTHFYPATDDPWLEDRNKFETQRLSVRVLSVEDGKVTARVDGDLKMRRAFYPGRSATEVAASVAGYLQYDLATQRVSRFRMATHAAKFGDEPFDVALREYGD